MPWSHFSQNSSKESINISPSQSKRTIKQANILSKKHSKANSGIAVDLLVHDQGIKYNGTIDSMKRTERVTIFES